MVHEPIRAHPFSFPPFRVSFGALWISPFKTGPLLFAGSGSLQSIVTTCLGAQNLSALAAMLQLSCLFAEVRAMTFQSVSGCHPQGFLNPEELGSLLN